MHNLHDFELMQELNSKIHEDTIKLKVIRRKKKKKKEKKTQVDINKSPFVESLLV